MLFVFVCLQEEKAELLQEVQTERENNASCGMFGFSPDVILYLSLLVCGAVGLSRGAFPQWAKHCVTTQEES